MVRAKWPVFEEVFLGFDPKRVRAMSGEHLEALMKDARILRHWGKIRATRANAATMRELAAEHGSFGPGLPAWPAEDIVGVWDDLPFVDTYRTICVGTPPEMRQIFEALSRTDAAA